MSVRVASFTDIPRIVELLVEACKRSRYNETEVKVDIQHMKSVLMSAIVGHDGKGEGATYVLVSERDGVVQGIIIGVACRIQEFSDRLYVSDLVFYQSEDAIATDALRLLRGVIEWAKGMTKVFEIAFGATDVIGEYDQTAKLYRQLGLHQTGVIYGMRAER